MLGYVLAYLRNYFPVSREFGTYRVENGSIDIADMQDGQYFRIVGSVFNDGVHRYPASGLTDEVFSGTVWSLAVPKDLLDLVAEIEEWQKKNGERAAGPYQSESFGGYSYTLKSGSEGFGASWQSAFASRLNVWRKI
jgi:hypothetical protein